MNEIKRNNTKRYGDKKIKKVEALPQKKYKSGATKKMGDAWAQMA